MTPSEKTIYTYLTEKNPEQPLFATDTGESYTCGQVKHLVEGYAARLLTLGLPEEGVVVLRIPRSPQGAILEFALISAGMQAMLADVHTTVQDYFGQPEFSETQGYLTNEGGSWVLITPDGAEKPVTPLDTPAALPKQNAKKPAVLITTSGSTGDKKTVVLSQFNLVNNLVDAAAFGDYIPGDVALGILPLFHIFGQVLLFGSVILNYSLIMPETVSPDSALRCVEKFGITRMNGVPSLYLAMAEKAEGFCVSTLRVGFIGGSPSSLKEIQYIEEKLGMKLLNAYGMSECVSISISNAKAPLVQRIGGVGQIYPMSRVRILLPNGTVAEPGEVGEITVSGASRMLGYYRDEAATKAVLDEDGFLHTGDLGYLDSAGILHITGRLKEIIIRNGVNISARKVEEALLAIPGISRAAVVGLPHGELGEVPAAVVVSDISQEEILAELRKALPKNEIPMWIFRVTALPLTASGKTDKQTIKNQLLSWVESSAEE